MKVADGKRPENNNSSQNMVHRANYSDLVVWGIKIEFKLDCEVRLTCFDEEKGIGHVARFIVVDEFFEPLLGLDACVSFDLIKRVNAVGVTSVFLSELVGQHKLEVKELSVSVTSAPVLALYDPGLPVLIRTDGSFDSFHNHFHRNRYEDNIANFRDNIEQRSKEPINQQDNHLIRPFIMRLILIVMDLRVTLMIVTLMEIRRI
ncbi:hypothetical protein FF38_04185 [Lucilia cuprina]|uniref:Uncharacterized protein n=1 Tax=Lucilia cuprina TaxID=7375 RepID=A0A0L0BTE6_LUCCU|nr:hypothetical protein FF38_04185 [Lucilia cuprina]